MNMRPEPMRPDPVRLQDAPSRPVVSLPQDAAPMHDARVLTRGGVQARILLDGQVYALRITRAGKLILTK